MRKAIRIHGDRDVLEAIARQVKILNQEEKNQIKFLGRNEFSMIGMEYDLLASEDRDKDWQLTIDAENVMLFYKLGLYTAPLIKNILK